MLRIKFSTSDTNLSNLIAIPAGLHINKEGLKKAFLQIQYSKFLIKKYL